jgi:hypothetical protein
MSQQTTPTPPLLTIEKEILMKERATLIDRLALVERRLGLESSIMAKGERRLAARIRDGIAGREPRDE